MLLTPLIIILLRVQQLVNHSIRAYFTSRRPRARPNLGQGITFYGLSVVRRENDTFMQACLNTRQCIPRFSWFQLCPCAACSWMVPGLGKSCAAQSQTTTTTATDSMYIQIIHLGSHSTLCLQSWKKESKTHPSTASPLSSVTEGLQ